jgi:hypothetical protein
VELDVITVVFALLRKEAPVACGRGWSWAVG